MGPRAEQQFRRIAKCGTRVLLPLTHCRPRFRNAAFIGRFGRAAVAAKT